MVRQPNTSFQPTAPCGGLRLRFARLRSQRLSLMSLGERSQTAEIQDRLARQGYTHNLAGEALPEVNQGEKEWTLPFWKNC